MFRLLFTFVLGLILARGVQPSTLTRDRNFDPSNKGPRDVETVAKMRYLDPRQVDGFHLDVPDLVDLDQTDEDMLDISDSQESEDTYWSLWSDWSDCPRSCGGGVTTRERRCISRYSASIVDLQCKGPSVEHRLCNRQACPDGSPEFRELQCSRRNAELILSRAFKWVPFAGKGGNTCELTCQAKQFHFYHSFGTALDGTTCGVLKRGICIQGECMKVGCDGNIGSDLTVDVCGVCGGRNATCYRQQNVVDRLPESASDSGYSKIVEIPIGATNIGVKDHNANYLALAEVEGDTETYIINGGWIISYTGEFKAAGAVAVYDRDGDKESFLIAGPTTKKLRIMVLSLGEQPLVEYEYWIPNTQRLSSSGRAEFRAQQSTIIHVPDEDDFRNQILEAGLDFDAVMPPTQTPSTTKATTTTTTQASTTEKEESDSQPGYYRPGSRPAQCTSCRKITNRKKQYCDSGFVIHVRILPKRRVQRGRFVRYEVEILNKYKSNVGMLHREYVWLSSTCCPRLRPYRHYMLMGRSIKLDSATGTQTDSIDRDLETRLVADTAEIWYTWRKYHVKMARAAKHINCKRYRYLAAKFYRRKLAES